jgi:hypothetical protein
MTRYGTGIDTLADMLDDRCKLSDDPSLDVIIHLALALGATRRIKENWGDAQIDGRPPVILRIEQAYREIMHVRSSILPNEMLDVSAITKFGRVIDESKIQSLLNG